MAKYKPGDKVRIRSDLKAMTYYSIEGRPEAREIAMPSMTDLAGREVTIKEVILNGKYRICEAGYYWTDEMFDSKPETIVIYRKGNKVIALNKITKETAEAKCSPEDTFDFATGAKLALDRLLKTEDTKFKVGDLVVGTQAASSEYVITHAGYVGKVLDISPGKAGLDMVIGSLATSHSYRVESKYFRLATDEDITLDLMKAVVRMK